MVSLRSRPAMNNVIVIGPNRPVNIAIEITTWAASLRWGVTPADQPTVPKAEITSKIAVRNSRPGCTMNRATTSRSNANVDVAATAIARWIFTRGISLPKTVVRSLPLKMANDAIMITISVLTLIPPAVDAETPPTNINPSVILVLEGCS